MSLSVSCFSFNAGTGRRHWGAAEQRLGHWNRGQSHVCGAQNCRTKDRPGHRALKAPWHESAVLATVNLADHTGEIEWILVDEKSLCDLAGVSMKDQLLTLLNKRGPEGICFKHPVDMRLSTNTRKASAPRSNMPAAAPGVLQMQEGETATMQLPECQFSSGVCTVCFIQRIQWRAPADGLQDSALEETRELLGWSTPLRVPTRIWCFRALGWNCEMQSFSWVTSVSWFAPMMRSQPAKSLDLVGMRCSWCCTPRLSRWGRRCLKRFLKLSADWNKHTISTRQITKCICWWGRMPQTNKVPTWRGGWEDL